MKKAIASVTGFALAVTMLPLFPAGINAETKLPFDLKAPQNVSLQWREGGDSPTTMNLSYGMDDAMVEFLKKMDPNDDGYEAAKEKLNSLGYYEDIWAGIQMDWAIDDTGDAVSGWHYNSYWDNAGQDEDYNTRYSCWDLVNWGIGGAQTTNTEWVLRGVGNIDDTENTDWFGTGVTPGVKDQLKEGQYDVIDDGDGGHTIKIDYTKHTAYARVRWEIHLWPLDGGDKIVVCSPWSETASYGAAGTKWEPYTKATLKPPLISDLKMAGTDSDANPLVSYTLTVPEDLKEGLVEVEARNGYIRLYTEARADGGEWVVLQDGDDSVVPGSIVVGLRTLVESGVELKADTKIEIRAHYYCAQYESAGGEGLDPFYTDYSNILSTSGEVTPGPGPAPTEDVVQEGMTEDEVQAVLAEFDGEEDPQGSGFAYLYARELKSAKKAVTLTWTKPSNAASFAVYGAKCGKNKFSKLADKLTDTTYTQKKLKKGKYYKYIVAAYDQSGKLLGASKIVHVATRGNKKAGNYKAIKTLAENGAVSLSLNGNASVDLNAKGVLEVKKTKVKEHRAFKYESSDEKIAVVDSKGTVTAKAAGTCRILVYAQNGVYQEVSVTVS